jgi:hypothetical protein
MTSTRPARWANAGILIGFGISLGLAAALRPGVLQSALLGLFCPTAGGLAGWVLATVPHWVRQWRRWRADA